MMVEILLETKSGETEEQLDAIVEEFVGRLTGKQTMYQMIELAEKIEERGGTPARSARVQEASTSTGSGTGSSDRIEELRKGHCSPEKYLVPGSRRAAGGSQGARLKMYLASGTDEVYMQEEAGCSSRASLLRWRRLRRARRLQELLEGDPDPAHHRVGGVQGRRVSRLRRRLRRDREREAASAASRWASPPTSPNAAKVDEWKRKRLVGVGRRLHHPELSLPR